MGIRAAIANILVLGILTSILILNADSGMRDGRSGPTNILLASKGVPGNIGLYSEVLAGLTLVQNQSGLEQAVNESTRAIVIDRSIAASLSTPFLMRQLARGVYIFGVNLSERELKTISSWDQAYELANGRPAPGSAIEAWGESPPYETFFAFEHIELGGYNGGMGRLDVRVGLFQVRLARAAGLSCKEGVRWSQCRTEHGPPNEQEHR